ncbi:PREDICTED: uncharacterized protein LOC106902886 [Calidris pugnax]|uniref:uncharacterized protein LOC106902886 n=1 Tax=Calidris pugnax TaxID=198806 RepID=UPI00071C2910|nr:PREDICTED: uncharacterized protein LOC106902886 [Calidris pugnax]
MRKTVHPKLHVSPGMYRSSYKRDYQWCEAYLPPREEDIQKLQIADAQLKAKEFAVPQEEQAMTFSDSVVWQRRKGIPAPSTKASSGADDTGEGYLPKYYPATELAAIQAEASERPRALAELGNEPSCCQHLPAAAQTAGTAGMFLRKQKLIPVWPTYWQFAMETSRARQHDAQQNKNMSLSSSALLEEYFDLDWRSTYDTDFQRWPGAHGGHCTANKSISHIFPEDENLSQNWVSEYKDNYSVFSQRLDQSSPVPAVGLCTVLSFGEGTAIDTAQ